MASFPVPHVLRCNLNDSGLFANDGFYIVSRGMIEVMEDRLDIYEFEDYIIGANAPPRPVLSVSFLAISSMNAGRFQSQHGNYEGGQIRLVGTFDRGVIERLTFRMAFDHVFTDFYGALKSNLNQHN